MAGCPRRFCGNRLFDNEERENPLRGLTRAIRRLATAGSGQAALFPDENLSPRELVRDFDRQALAAREFQDAELSPSQLASLARLESELSTMSRDGAEFDADIWTDEAVRTSEYWAEVRRLAAAALDEFSQPAE